VKLSNILRKTDGGPTFWCPGCECAHVAYTGRWEWNHDYERPTFRPSLLVKYDHWVPPATPLNPSPGPQTLVKDVCHSFVTDGFIQFLSDCTHKLAGQTVPLPEWPWKE
jgi:hypothetical protein